MSGNVSRGAASVVPSSDPPIGIVIGASNVTRCIGAVVAGAAEAMGGRVDLRIVAGRGRSFGVSSRVVLRSLPSIADCPLWRDLRASSERQVARALITDVGNDIMYGHDPETILRWVDDAARRCRDSGARVTIGRVPLDRLGRLSPLTYEVVRAAFFGRHGRFPLREALRRAAAVDEGLAEIAIRHDATTVSPEAAWYGVDPIHIRLRTARQAWRTIFEHWREPPGVNQRSGADGLRPEAVSSIARADVWWAQLRLTCALPASARIAGVPCGDPTRPPAAIEVLRAAAIVRLY